MKKGQIMTDRIKEIISQTLDIPVDEIDVNADIIEVYGADSLDTVDMLMMIEDEFEIAIPDEEAIELRTINKLVSYIEDNK